MLLTPDILKKLGRCQLLAPRIIDGLPLTGIHRSRRNGAALEFDQYRLYVPGDELRQVDWRLFARTDQLAVRRQTTDTPFRLAVILDCTASMGYAGRSALCSKMRLGGILAACLAYLAHRQGDELGLFCYGGKEASARSGNALAFQDFCMRVDALAAQGGDTPGKTLDQAAGFLANRGMAVWISDFLEGEDFLEAQLRGLQGTGCGCCVMQVLDREEQTLPFSAARHFLDPEEKRPGMDVFSEEARQEYLSRFQEHQRILREICTRQEVRWLSLTTADDVGARIAEFLEGTR